MDVEPEGSKTCETCRPLPSPIFVDASTPAEVDRTQHLIQPARRDLGYSHGWASSDVQLDDRGDQDDGAPPEGDDGINPSPVRRGRSRVETGSHGNSTSSQTTFEAQGADGESVAKSKKKGKASMEVKVPLIVRQLDAHNESPVSNLTFRTAYYTLIKGDVPFLDP